MRVLQQPHRPGRKINDIPLKVVNGTPVWCATSARQRTALIQTSVVRVMAAKRPVAITRQEGPTHWVTDGVRAKLHKLYRNPRWHRSNSLRPIIHSPSHGNLEGRVVGAGLAGLMIFPFLQASGGARRGFGDSAFSPARSWPYLTGQTVNIRRGLALVIGRCSITTSWFRRISIGISKWARMAVRRKDSATERPLPILVATICILIVYLDHVFPGIVKYLFVHSP
jgi:hypothetical protein